MEILGISQNKKLLIETVFLEWKNIHFKNSEKYANEFGRYRLPRKMKNS